MRAERSFLGPYVLIDAGPEPYGPPPVRRGAFPFRTERMKPLLIVGILVAALGVFVLANGLSYPSHRSVVKVGDFEAGVQETHAVPQWAGIVALVGGVVLIGVGLRGRKA
jgi:drug/metabolite transporter (DMT)-like permease